MNTTEQIGFEVIRLDGDIHQFMFCLYLIVLYIIYLFSSCVLFLCYN